MLALASARRSVVARVLSRGSGEVGWRANEAVGVGAETQTEAEREGESTGESEGDRERARVDAILDFLTSPCPAKRSLSLDEWVLEAEAVGGDGSCGGGSSGMGVTN